MQLFYVPELETDKYTLSFEESKHCIKVLRMKKGDFLYLTDGKGILYKAGIIDPDPKKCQVEIYERFLEYGKRGYTIHIAIAPTKNIKRMEWFLEKCTEIGIDKITFLNCRFSERKHIRPERFQRVIVAAMKQSVKAYLPELNPMVDYQEFINEEKADLKFIALCDEQKKKHLKNMYSGGKDVTVVIGPEGDYSEEEKKWAFENNFKPVSLGSSRLRTETAGIVACHTISLINEK